MTVLRLVMTVTAVVGRSVKDAVPAAVKAANWEENRASSVDGSRGCVL